MDVQCSYMYMYVHACTCMYMDVATCTYMYDMLYQTVVVSIIITKTVHS